MTPNKSVNHKETLALAAAVRDACVQAALDAYETARMDGLCHDGAWEVAVSAMRALNVERVVHNMDAEKRAQGS